MRVRAHQLWVAGALALASCAHQTSYTAGDSMVPTIAVGKRVAVNVAAVTLMRGSVVVFRVPEAPARLRSR